MAAVAALTTADDRVFFVSGGFGLQVHYYLDQARYDVPKDENARYVNVTGVPTGDSEDLPTMMGRVFSGSPRFWLIEIEAAYNHKQLERIKWIDDHYQQIFRIPVGYNGISLYSLDGADPIPESTAFIPPSITEARPGDQVRIGVPAGTRVDLVHSGQVVDTRQADTWMLHEFNIYSFYYNGLYILRVADYTFPFTITNSREFPKVK